MKFDIEINRQFDKNIIIEYGIIKGNATIVFIKAGQDGSLYGYHNKYLKMAKRLNKKYGCSVVCSSNPFDGRNPLDNAMEVIEEYAKIFGDYSIYYLGYSNGGLIGVWFGTNYEKIKRIAVVNPPLMFNYHKTKQGALNFKGERITFVYGTLDQSIQYVPLLDSIKNNKIKVITVAGADHHFSNNAEDFYKIPEENLFYDM